VIIDEENRICIGEPPVELVEYNYITIGNKHFAFMKTPPRTWKIYPSFEAYDYEIELERLKGQTYKDMFDERLSER